MKVGPLTNCLSQFFIENIQILDKDNLKCMYTY